MAYIRQPSSDGAGTSYIRVLADGLGTNQIAELTIHCSNGRSYNASVEGGTTGNYRSTTQTFTGLASDTWYDFWATGRTSGGTAINVPSSSFKTLTSASTRPDNFSWTNEKSSGNQYNLTSSEWYSLLHAINLFRTYKKLDTRTFNHSVSNGLISGYVVPSANSFNAARNAINDMSPPVSAPRAVFPGGRIYAVDLNRLVSSLNSIV